MAVESPFIVADVIEVSEFPEVAQQYKVLSVPKVVVNEQVSFEGALPEAGFLDKVLEATRGTTPR